MRKYLCGFCALVAVSAGAQTQDTIQANQAFVKENVVATETLTEPVKASAEETTHKVTITHAVGYAPYEEGRPIEAFFAGLVGTHLDSYVIQQYYQPADDVSRHCFILVSEEAQKKVKKCVQLEPTVAFKEDELYTVLGDNE